MQGESEIGRTGRMSLVYGFIILQAVMFLKCVDHLCCKLLIFHSSILKHLLETECCSLVFYQIHPKVAVDSY